MVRYNEPDRTTVLISEALIIDTSISISFIINLLGKRLGIQKEIAQLFHIHYNVNILSRGINSGTTSKARKMEKREECIFTNV